MTTKKLPKLFLILSLLCLAASCKNGPKLKVCISDPQAGGLDCYDQTTEQSSFMPYPDTDRYVCLSPSDSQALLSFCARGNNASNLD